jgi:hypothetical protein
MQSRATPAGGSGQDGDHGQKYNQPAEREKLIQRLLQQRRIALQQQEDLEKWKNEAPQQQQAHLEQPQLVTEQTDQQSERGTSQQMKPSTEARRSRSRSRSRTRQPNGTPGTTRQRRPQSAGPRVSRVHGGGVVSGNSNFSRKSLDQVRRQVALDNEKVRVRPSSCLRNVAWGDQVRNSSLLVASVTFVFVIVIVIVCLGFSV